MNKHYQIHKDTGFLFHPQPIHALTREYVDCPDAALDAFNTALKQLPELISGQQPDALLGQLSHFDYTVIDWEAIHKSLLEFFFTAYGYLASAWVHGFQQEIVPQAIAVPLVQAGQRLGRPPILSYSGQVLNNWRLLDEEAGFTPENIALLHQFTRLVDESWFFRVHIAIEAQAGPMLVAMEHVDQAIRMDDDVAIMEDLRTIHNGLVQITKTFHYMPEFCAPDTYFHHVRPYLMSIEEEVRFEGVDQKQGLLRGGSGAQSSIVPALLAGLGISHESTLLTASLQDMRRYMPVEHRQFIEKMGQNQLREYCAQHPPMRDAYNHILRQLTTFRRAHLYYAKTYIFEKSPTMTGSGGTNYMDFLSKLIEETMNYTL